MHSGDERFHVSAGHGAAEIPQDDRTEDVQAGMRTHEAGAAFIVEATAYGCAGRGQGVSLGWQEVEIVTPARADDPSPDIPPQEHAVIGRLPAAAGIERGPVQNDALIGVSQQHGSAPLADRGVVEVESVRVVPMRGA